MTEQKQDRTERWPVDWDSLKKGDFIDRERCEKIVDCPSDSPKYALKLLSFKETVEREMADRGKPVTVRVDHGSLKILTDSEASAYNEDRQRASLRAFSRGHRRNVAVDVAELNDEDKAKHERRLLVGGTILTAIQSARSKLSLIKHKDERPKLGTEVKE